MEKLTQLLEEIYQDGKVTTEEILKLRQLSERATVDLLAQAGDEGVINALSKSFEVTVQLMQASLLKVRKEKAAPEVKQALANLIEAHIELMRANYHAFSSTGSS